MSALADLLDPKLVLARDLAFTQSDSTAVPLKPKKRKRSDEPPVHIVIPDLQVKPDIDTRNIDWIGSYIADEFGDRENVKVICLGDFWDMPSLSMYDRGKREMEGRRFVADVAAGNEAFARLDKLIPKRKSWEYHFLFGNHEDRITRAASNNAQLDGLLSLALLDTKQWERHDFLDVVWLDGVAYSHYFYNWNTGRALGGENLGLRLKTIGHSFTMGHQQGLLYSVRNTTNGMHHGLVAGSAYLHDEEYRGPQAQDHWRGIVACHQVEGGTYDPMFVSLDFLARRYEGMRLVEYLSAN